MKASAHMLKKLFYLCLCSFGVLMLSCASEEEGGAESEGGGLSSFFDKDKEEPEGGTDTGSGETDLDNANFPSFFSTTFNSKSEADIMQAIDQLIDPEIGVYLVYKPGALPTPQRVTSATELKSTFNTIGETLTAITCIPKKGDLPYYDCDTFDKEGCFYKETTNGEALQNYMARMAEMLATEFSEEQFATARQADSAISHVMVSTDAFVEMGFGKVKGQWRLISINIAAFDCGA